MRGLGGITGLLDQFLAMAGVHLAPWMAPVAVLVLMVALLPLILRNMRTGRARKLMKQAAMVAGPEGARLEQSALELVGSHAVGLVGIADEALRRGRTALAREAFERLLATGKERQHARRIYRALDGDLPRTVDEMVVILDHLVEAGLFGEARRRLDRAFIKWPDAPELVQVQAGLDALGAGYEELGTGLRGS